jgi:hypothetical protein
MDSVFNESDRGRILRSHVHDYKSLLKSLNPLVSDKREYEGIVLALKSHENHIKTIEFLMGRQLREFAPLPAWVEPAVIFPDFYDAWDHVVAELTTPPAAEPYYLSTIRAARAKCAAGESFTVRDLWSTFATQYNRQATSAVHKLQYLGLVYKRGQRPSAAAGKRGSWLWHGSIPISGVVPVAAVVPVADGENPKFASAWAALPEIGVNSKVRQWVRERCEMEESFTTADAGRNLDVSESTVYRLFRILVRLGLIKSTGYRFAKKVHPIGKPLRIYETAINPWLM